MGVKAFAAIAPAAGIVVGGGLALVGVDSAIAWTAGITVTTALWWVTEAIPIPAASLFPFAAFPFAGVMTHAEAGAALGNTIILLLMGAFMLSKGLEKSGVHERFAAGMIRLIGRNRESEGAGGARLVLAFMITAAVLSMWISNTATVLMLTPMALALLARSPDPRLAVPLLLGIAYASSLGGTGTLIGTPPNLIFAGIYEQETGQEFGFLEWMKTGVPIVIVGLPLMALWLCRGLGGVPAPRATSTGPWRSSERRVLAIFAVTVAAWITRSEPFGGWSGWLGVDGVADSTIALMAVVAMFLVPDGEGDRLLDWKTAVTIPWGMLLLFAGGICIANAFMLSGLSAVIGDTMAGFGYLPLFLLLIAICISVTFLTEITSNTATATLLMPILAAAAIGVSAPPELFMIPAAISASCAFMLPVATAPNAIIYATERVSIRRMAGEGAVLNVLIAVIVATACYLTLS
jgi:sodium-dependent dicarboxylate transporter 2/3/5